MPIRRTMHKSTPVVMRVRGKAFLLLRWYESWPGFFDADTVEHCGLRRLRARMWADSIGFVESLPVGYNNGLKRRELSLSLHLIFIAVSRCVKVNKPNAALS
jgi:hypothetical protein